ncbi:hypothetical protein tinsulaeT_34630 [Thalassotalea insulae]|uniref:DUF1425 domain-containing protein n=1 Tax=Thalassotalea insulae TaxID=2056778 RepID=A0ABQ6GW21_9GAMM|nr:YcfL family protein [Thalassotalea insulae]GLX80123.1 hypothetical protein tinsulaeT_34630 [Thalassotalea insulae]
MNKCFLNQLATTLLLLVLVGCHSTSSPVSAGIGAESMTNETPPATYLKVDNDLLAERITISDVKHRRINDLLEVNVELSSQYDQSQQLQYQFNWFDEQGFSVEPGKSLWKPLEIHGLQSTFVRGIAPSAKVTSFNVYVRHASPKV